MKVLIAGLFFVVSSLSFGQANPAVYGQWAFPEIQAEGVVVKTHLVFEAGQSTAIAECSGFGQTAVSKVSAPTDYTADTITVEAAAQHTEVVGGLECDASLSVGTINYTLSQDNQSLEMSAGGSSLTLAREN